MKYWILDKSATPQGFPLKQLVLDILTFLPKDVSFRVIVASGYGEHVCFLDEKTDFGPVEVSMNFLFPLISGVEEWFYDIILEITSIESRVLCGIHDSYMMFIEGEEAIVKDVISNYQEVEQYRQSKLLLGPLGGVELGPPQQKEDLK